MSRIRLFIVVLVLNVAFVNESIAAPEVPSFQDTEFFYELGGGTGIAISGGVQVPNTLMLERDFAMLFSGGKFDPIASIKATLNNLRDEAKSKLVGIGNGITSSISAIPGYIFCRENPLGCQMHENYTQRAEAKSKTAVKFLEDMEAQVGESRQTLEGWFQAAKGDKLVTAMAEAEAAGVTDLETVVDEVREFSGKEGLKWLGGVYAGGDNQPPIRPIADTAKAGFNFLHGQTVSNDARVTGDDPMLAIWDTPEEAAKWLSEVVGEFRPDINNNPLGRAAGSANQGADDGDSGQGGEDVIVTAAFTSNDVSTPALGLVSKVRKESVTVREKLNTLASLSGIPTAEQVSQIMGASSNSVIPRDLFLKLRSTTLLNPALQRIADDIAISNVIRYAMEARRLLISGRNEPHIASYSVAQDEIAQKISILEKDIEMLMFERRVSQELLSDTIQTIYRGIDSQAGSGTLLIRPVRGQSFGNGVAN